MVFMAFMDGNFLVGEPLNEAKIGVHTKKIFFLKSFVNG